MSKISRNQKGFTLLELMIAIVILTIGLVGVLSLLPVTSRSIGEARQLTISTELAQEGLEDIRALPYSQIPDSIPAHYPHGYFGYLREVDVDDGDDPSTWESGDGTVLQGIKRVTCIVRWKDSQGMNREVSLATDIISFRRTR